jgi:uncharacterized membrane protein SpoIIM required for sporulation
MMKRKWILTKVHVTGILIVSCLLGVWVLGADTEEYSVLVTKDQIERHKSEYSGSGMPPDALEGKERIEVDQFRRVYTFPSVLFGGITGFVLGLVGLPVMNWLLTWQPKQEPGGDRL